MKKMPHYLSLILLGCFVFGVIFIIPASGKSQSTTSPAQLIQTAPAPDLSSHEGVPVESPLPIFLLEQDKKSKKTILKISPNPVELKATIKIVNPNHKTYTLLIYNFIGEVVRQIDQLTMREFSIERGNLKSGIYFLQLYHQNIRITTTKMIIH